MFPSWPEVVVVGCDFACFDAEHFAADIRGGVEYRTSAAADAGKEPAVIDGQAGESTGFFDVCSRHLAWRSRLKARGGVKALQRGPFELVVVSASFSERQCTAV